MPALLALLLASTAAQALPVEGERIASVRIDAPAAEAARLAAYVDITPGVSYRAEAVRHAVELIHATGEYQDVLVEAERGPEGVVLVLRPVRAPLLAGIVVEGDAVLDARALRRLSRLRPREPLWPARLALAAFEVRQELVRQGYLDAQVVARTRPAAGGALAVFAEEAGPRLRMSSARVVVEDGAPALVALLQSRASPRPGSVFRREKAEEAVRRMQRDLLRRGYWRAHVTLESSRESGQPSVSLVFRVAAGPRMTLEFRGASPSHALRGEIESRLRESGLTPDVREQAADRLEDELRRQGHRAVRLLAREEPRAFGAALVYDVEPGPLSRVESVRIAGEEDGLADVPLGTRAGAPLDQAVLAADVSALQRALEERGYAQARVEAEAPDGAGEVPVVFRVNAGPRLIVGSVEVLSPVPLPEPSSPQLRLRAGEPYRVQDLARDRQALIAAYRDLGYPQIEVTPEVSRPDPQDHVRVSLSVAPGTQLRVDRVVIAGLQTTREEVVRRELLLKEGEPLGLERVLESQRRLGSLGIFERVSLREMDPDSPQRRTVVVAAEEAPRTTVAYGVGYAERDLLRGSAEVTRRNLFGLNRSLSTFARYSFRGSRFLATFREPFLLGHRQELFATVFREEEDRPAFDFVRTGGLLQTVRQHGPWTVIARYTYQLTDSFNIINPDEVGREFTTSTLSGPSTSVVNDTRDDPVDPRRGRFVSADVQLSHTVLGGDSFAKAFLQAAGYHRLASRLVLALSGRLGLARTFGDAPPLLPRPDRFYAGGDYSLRGFALDAVGPLSPSASGVLEPTGGNALVLGGAELRLDAGRYLSLAAFTDAGNVYALVSDITVRDVRYTAGVGLRYRSALGPLRVDWGYKLDRRPGESPYRFHFTLGHAF